MPNPPGRDHRPQYGWSPKTIINDVVLGEPSGLLPSVTDPALRIEGMLRGAVTAIVRDGDITGSGTFGLLLQGSHTGGTDDAEWVTIGQTNMQELFTSAVTGRDQFAILGFSNGRISEDDFIGEGQISFGRWKYLRLQTFVQTGTPSFEMTVNVTGIADDGLFAMDSETLVRTSGDTTEPEGEELKRPNGVRYIVGQVVVEDMILLGGTDGFNFLLQASIDLKAAIQGDWFTIDVLGPFTSAGDVGFFANGQVRNIDLAAFRRYRVIAEKADNGDPVDDTSSFTATYYIGHDDCDWRSGEQGINQLNDALKQTFAILVAGPVTGVAPSRTVTIQLLDMNMVPIRATRNVGVLLSNSILGGSNDLATTGTIDSASVGSIQYGAGTNVAVVRTNSDGIATLTIDANADSPLYLAAWEGHFQASPNSSQFGPGMIIISSQKVELVPP